MLRKVHLKWKLNQKHMLNQLVDGVIHNFVEEKIFGFGMIIHDGLGTGLYLVVLSANELYTILYRIAMDGNGQYWALLG